MNILWSNVQEVYRDLDIADIITAILHYEAFVLTFLSTLI